MKVALGSKIIEGPWGGGNNFIKNFSNFLKKKDCEVYHELKIKDLDIILLTDPREKSKSASFNHFDIYNYIKKINKNTIVVHRINECDERKNTKDVNNQIVLANRFSDYTVFISKWLSEIFSNHLKKKSSSVIYNGANLEIFFNNSLNFTKKEKFKLVTHHWSNHKNKGFDIYKKIDDQLEQKNFHDKIQFTIIGNLPSQIKFKNINYIKPLFGIELADALRNHHAYITGSLNEPGGNHQNEAINCGLPALYLDSGCMKEYCKGFGLEYTNENLFQKIDQLIDDYTIIKNNLNKYDLNSNNTCNKYFDLFQNLLSKKKEIIEDRNWPNISNYQIITSNLKRFLS